MSVGGDDDTIAGAVPTLGNANDDPGDLIAGRYRIVRWLGGGGMGRVYEALDVELHEKVALKVLKSGLSEDALERFRREVKLTRRIQHPNVARMYDLGVHGKDKFLTMELVEGESLARSLKRPIAIERVLELAQQLAAGLVAAHDKGVVHRDLKPDNVLIERATGRAVITDFGIARSADDPSVTQVGSVVGTPRYMAPEQLAGREADARSDLFAFGIMLYEMTTGARPWVGDNAIAIAVAQATRPVPPLPDSVPPSLAQLIARCLELEADRRPGSARAVADSLDAILPLLVTGPTKIRTSGQIGIPRPAPSPSQPPPAPHAVPPSGSVAAPVAPTAVTTWSGAATSLAVLPLACAPGDEYLADAVLEDLIDTLSSTDGLKVRPAGIVRAKTDPDPRELGRSLEVDHVITGSIRRTPAGIRVSARLISISDGFQIWAHRAEGIDTDVLAISEQLGRGIASALSTRATAPTRPTDPRAVELYLRARAELRLFWGSHAAAAADLLDQAYELSPSSAPIAGARALAATSAWVMSGERRFYARAKEAIDRGLATSHPEAYLASSQFKLNINDPIGGARDLGIALVRAPMLARAHEMAGHVLVEVDAIAEARTHFETARELDPTRGHVILTELARLDALEGQWARADASIETVCNDPDRSIAQLGAVYKVRLATWRGDRATISRSAQAFTPRMGARASQLANFISMAADSELSDPQILENFLGAFGGPERAHRPQLIGLQLLSEIALALDRPELALDTLEQADRLGLIDVVVLDHCPLFESLAIHPRFRSIRARVADRAANVLAAFRSTAG